MSSVVRFEADGGSIELRLQAYEFPEETTGADANWVSGEVELVGSGIERGVAVQALHFRTDELDQLRNDLAAMLAVRSDRVSTAHIEEQFEIAIGHDEGRFTVDAWVSDYETKESSGPLTIDRAGLEASLDQLNHATEEFPVKGDAY
ncbi:MAG: hypothetical protein GXX91_16435 [Verrucomicrobiaceae bacterium]|nr:hypothetical protein [Verrucomicrobiaceae bacterium]